MLCLTIVSKTGEKEVKSEAYVNAFLKGRDKIYSSHYVTSGGYLSSEVKLTITLRLLVGGDALDLAIICDVEPCYCTKIIHEVLLY